MLYNNIIKLQNLKVIDDNLNFNFKFAIEKVPKNSDYTFPFCKASIGMVKLITTMLHICEDG